MHPIEGGAGKCALEGAAGESESLVAPAEYLLRGGVCGPRSRASPASRAPWEWSAKGPGMVTDQESLEYRMKPDSEQVLRRKDEKNSEGRVQRECEISATECEGRDGLRLGSELATELAGDF